MPDQAHPDRVLSVAWLGVGAIGKPMAQRVASATGDRLRLRLYDLDQARYEGIGGRRVSRAASAAEAGRGADVVVCMVADGAQLREALLGEAGAAGGLRPGSVVLVMSTVGIAAVTALAGELRPKRIAVVDAPVSGGPARAATGDLLIVVAGEPEPAARVRPVLDLLGSPVVPVGSSPGAGQAVKLVNQLLCGVHIAAAAEALALASALGTDPGMVWDALRHGAATSFMFEDRGARMVTGDHGDVRGALDIFVKDLGLVTDAAQRAQASVPLATVAYQLFRQGSAAGLGRLDDSSIIGIYGNAARPPV